MAGPARLIREVVGAVMVGVATLFQPKRDREQHWSIPPTWPVEDRSGDETDEP